MHTTTLMMLLEGRIDMQVTHSFQQQFITKSVDHTAIVGVAMVISWRIQCLPSAVPGVALPPMQITFSVLWLALKRPLHNYVYFAY